MDSFMNLNGPSADNVQSDYIDKEIQAANELLKLQKGNAEILYKLRLKLLSDLGEEALAQGKTLEDVLAEYGLNKRLSSLATELQAEQKARTEGLAQLTSAREESAARLKAAEVQYDKQRTKILNAQAAKQTKQLTAQRKADLAHIKQEAKLEAKLHAAQQADLKAATEQHLARLEEAAEAHRAAAGATIAPVEFSTPEPPTLDPLTLQVDTEVEPPVLPIIEAQEQLITPIIEPASLELPEIKSPTVEPELQVPTEPILVEADVNLPDHLADANLSTSIDAEVNLPTSLPSLQTEADVSLPDQLKAELELEAAPVKPELSESKLTVEVESGEITTPEISPIIEPPALDPISVKVFLNPEPLEAPSIAIPTELAAEASIASLKQQLESGLDAPLELKPVIDEIGKLDAQTIEAQLDLEPLEVSPVTIPAELEAQESVASLKQQLEASLPTQVELKPVIEELEKLDVQTVELEPTILPITEPVVLPTEAIQPTVEGIVEPLALEASAKVRFESLDNTQLDVPEHTAALKLIPELTNLEVLEGLEANVKLSLEDLPETLELASYTPETAARLEADVRRIGDIRKALLQELLALEEQIAEERGSLHTPELEDRKQSVTEIRNALEEIPQEVSTGLTVTADTTAAREEISALGRQAVTEAKQVFTTITDYSGDVEAAVLAPKVVVDQEATPPPVAPVTPVAPVPDNSESVVDGIKKQVEVNDTVISQLQSIEQIQASIQTKAQELATIQSLSEVERSEKAIQANKLAFIEQQLRLEQERHKTLMQFIKTEQELRTEVEAELEQDRLAAQQKEFAAKKEQLKKRVALERHYQAVALKESLAGLKDKNPEMAKKYAEEPAKIKTDFEDRLSGLKESTAEVDGKTFTQALQEESASIDKDESNAKASALKKAQAAAKREGKEFTAEDEKAVLEKVHAEFDLRRQLVEAELASKYAGEEAGLKDLANLRKSQLKAEQDAKKKADAADKKAEKKAKGHKSDLEKDYGLGGKYAAAAGVILGKKDPEIEALAETDPEAAQQAAQAKLNAAFDTMGNLINDLANKGKVSADKQSAIDTRLQGLDAKNMGKGGNKILGSYWRGLSTDISVGIGMSPFLRTEKVEENFANLIGQGIAYNIKERAFLASLKDKIATTFEVADGTLLKLVRIQQADTTASRLGMESALTEFLNSMYATTEYMQQAAATIRAGLYEATALMGAKEATEFEYQVQKWMGSLYSVGFSNAENLAAALGKLTAGDIGGITEGGLGNLLIMAANEASLPIADILEKGLTAQDTNKLMESMVEYLAKIYKETAGSNVLAQQFAGVYGLTASDLKAAANLSSSLEAVSSNNETYKTMLKQVEDMSSSMILRTSTAEMMENMKENFTYSMATTLANNPVLSSLNLMANMLNDLVGGIEIPFVNVYGFGFDLNATVADLMNVAALSGTILGGVGKMVAGLGNLNPKNMLKTFGVEQGEGSLDVLSRGSGNRLDLTTQSGATESESGYIGNENSDDITNKTVQDASEGPENQVAEAKEEKEDKEEARAQALTGHIVDIYDLLQEVVAGTKKFHVQLEIGNNPLTWASGTWN